jgi:hypothetical protein
MTELKSYLYKFFWWGNSGTFPNNFTSESVYVQYTAQSRSITSEPLSYLNN